MKAQATHMTLRYALVLVALSTVAYFCVVAYLLATGHGLLMKPDGVALYYTYFTYEGQMLREGLAALTSGAAPTLPEFTFNAGYGADILGMMNGTVNNPLNLLAVFFPPELAEFGYYFEIWIRVQLVGFGFSLYCFNRGKEQGPVLVGALCYLLCGFMVYWGMLRHPGFMIVGALLPMVLLGADKLFEGKSPLWLIGSIGASFVLSVYFTYMICLFMLGYCLVKYFFAPRERSIGDFVRLVAKFVGCLAVGFAIGAVGGFPLILQMTSMGRVTQSLAIPLFHDALYYAALPAGMTGLYVSTRGVYLGAVALLLVLVFALCGKRFDAAERKPWLIGLAAVLVMVCIPWFGSFFNGFGYVSDRWMVLLGFCVAYCACLAVPVMGSLVAKEWRRVLIALGAFVVFGLAAALLKGSKGAIPIAVVSVVLVAIVVVVFAKGRKHATATLCAATLLCATCAVGVYCSPLGKSYAESFIGFGDAYHSVFESSPARAMQKIKNDGYRYSMPAVLTTQANNDVVTGEMGISIFSSFYNQAIDDLRDDLGISTNHINFIYGGNDCRLAVDALSGARYFVATDDQTWRVPYTYKKTNVSAAGYDVYKSDDALPMAFFYENAVRKSDYDALSTVGKQEALLEGCVVDDAAVDGDSVQPEASARVCPVSVEGGPGIVVEDGKIIVSSEDARATLRFEGLPNCETYLCVDNLMFQGLNDTDAARLTGEEAPSGIRTQVSDFLYTQPDEYFLVASSEGYTRRVEIDTMTSTKWVGRVDWAINFGYFEKPFTEMRIGFTEPGIYTFDSLRVECQPVEPIAGELEELKGASASDVQLGDDSVSARFDAKAPGYAFFTVPYSKGWTATVDGKPAQLTRAGVGFIAVHLDDAGAHDVALKYETPGLRMGALVSLAGVAAFVLIAIWIGVRARGSRRK